MKILVKERRTLIRGKNFLTSKLLPFRGFKFPNKHISEHFFATFYENSELQDFRDFPDSHQLQLDPFELAQPFDSVLLCQISPWKRQSYKHLLHNSDFIRFIEYFLNTADSICPQQLSIFLKFPHGNSNHTNTINTIPIEFKML